MIIQRKIPKSRIWAREFDMGECCGRRPRSWGAFSELVSWIWCFYVTRKKYFAEKDEVGADLPSSMLWFRISDLSAVLEIGDAVYSYHCWPQS